MPEKIDHLTIAKSLTGGQPLAYAVKDDGSLVVVAHTGQKFRFTADQVQKEAEKLKPEKPKAASKPQPAPAAKKPAPKTTAKK